MGGHSKSLGSKEACKDVLSATGNYAQPEVTTLT